MSAKASSKSPFSSPFGRRKLLSSSVLSQDRGKLGVTLEDPLPDSKGEFAGSPFFLQFALYVCSEVFCGLFFPFLFIQRGRPARWAVWLALHDLHRPSSSSRKKEEDGGQPHSPPNGPGKMSASSFSLSSSLRPPSSSGHILPSTLLLRFPFFLPPFSLDPARSLRFPSPPRA